MKSLIFDIVYHGRGCFCLKRKGKGWDVEAFGFTVGLEKHQGFQVLSPPLRHGINGNCTQRRGLPGWKDAWQQRQLFGQIYVNLWFLPFLPYILPTYSSEYRPAYLTSFRGTISIIPSFFFLQNQGKTKNEFMISFVGAWVWAQTHVLLHSELMPWVLGYLPRHQGLAGKLICLQ